MTLPVYQKNPIQSAMDIYAQKTVYSASESLFYQKNLFQRSIFRKQKAIYFPPA
jgi:hypothetical protein